MAQNVDAVLHVTDGLHALISLKIPNLAGSVPGTTDKLILPMLLKGDYAARVSCELSDLNAFLCEETNLRGEGGGVSGLVVPS